MTEYTWDKKTGKVKSKGKGKKPINLKQLAIDAIIPFPLQKPIMKLKKFLKKKKKKTEPAKDLDKTPPDDTTPPDRPKAVWVSKGGSVKLAKKYFKGGMV